MIGKIRSWNVRGINDRKKRQIIRGFMSRWKPDIICLQETKMEALGDKEIRSLWRVKEIGMHCRQKEWWESENLTYREVVMGRQV